MLQSFNCHSWKVLTNKLKKLSNFFLYFDLQITIIFYSTTSLRRHAANFHECEWNQAQGLSDLENSTSSEINVFTSSPSENSKSKRSLFNGRALIYELFEKISEKEAQCKICYVVLKITRGSTTDIRHHALRYHESGMLLFLSICLHTNPVNCLFTPLLSPQNGKSSKKMQISIDVQLNPNLLGDEP